METELMVVPSQLLSFGEVLVFIGCNERDVVWFSGLYDNWDDAIEDMEFFGMLLEMDIKLPDMGHWGVRYWDNDLQMNIEVSVVGTFGLYNLRSF